ncbi:MAG: hypothetical protein K2X74_08765, partial [Acetobacteraceae bacterium]|nr:hypothetical protein [Acetobacteraceae bacterium]
SRWWARKAFTRNDGTLRASIRCRRFPGSWTVRNPGLCLTAILTLGALLDGAAMPSGARAAGFLQESDWLAAVSGSPILEMPAHTAMAQDAYATYAQGVPQVITFGTSSTPGGPTVTRAHLWDLDTSAGQMQGAFRCYEFAYPCLGAYRITYIFPFAITALAGHLTQDVGPDRRPELDFFGIPAPSFRCPDPYYPCSGPQNIFSAFYGATFAPTDTINITWPPGIFSRDDWESFRLTNARVVPAPEPSTAAVMASALLLLLALHGRRTAAGVAVRSREVQGP